jgi:hypothetical protein
MNRNPFHDLQRKRPGHSRHVRLISEGGNSLAKSPLPLCIDSIQASQACTTESHHLPYRATTGAYSMFSLPDSLFSVPLEDAKLLDQGLIPELITSRCQQRGISLSSAARVDVHHAGRVWYLRDQERSYTIRRLPSRLTVYLDK